MLGAVKHLVQRSAVDKLLDDGHPRRREAGAEELDDPWVVQTSEDVDLPPELHQLRPRRPDPAPMQQLYRDVPGRGIDQRRAVHHP